MTVAILPVRNVRFDRTGRLPLTGDPVGGAAASAVDAGVVCRITQLSRDTPPPPIDGAVVAAAGGVPRPRASGSGRPLSPGGPAGATSRRVSSETTGGVPAPLVVSLGAWSTGPDPRPVRQATARVLMPSRSPGAQPSP